MPTDIGTIEGVLHMSEGRLCVADPVTGALVRIESTPRQADLVRQLVGNRVSIECNTADGWLHVAMSPANRFGRLRERQELPQAADIRGINITDGMDSAEYVRKLRGS